MEGMQIKARLVDPPVDAHPADNLVKDKRCESKNMGEELPNFDAAFCLYFRCRRKFKTISRNGTTKKCKEDERQKFFF